ncbi:MAG: hypothetical protein HUJ96_01340 [Marinilabiliaceae bacterium]|nr:hypothetical protein [Marinilabiliaceae bacterium]
MNAPKFLVFLALGLCSLSVVYGQVNLTPVDSIRETNVASSNYGWGIDYANGQFAVAACGNAKNGVDDGVSTVYIYNDSGDFLQKVTPPDGYPHQFGSSGGVKISEKYLAVIAKSSTENVLVIYEKKADGKWKSGNDYLIRYVETGTTNYYFDVDGNNMLVTYSNNTGGGTKLLEISDAGWREVDIPEQFLAKVCTAVAIRGNLIGMAVKNDGYYVLEKVGESWEKRLHIEGAPAAAKDAIAIGDGIVAFGNRTTTLLLAKEGDDGVWSSSSMLVGVKVNAVDIVGDVLIVSSNSSNMTEVYKNGETGWDLTATLSDPECSNVWCMAFDGKHLFTSYLQYKYEGKNSVGKVFIYDLSQTLTSIHAPKVNCMKDDDATIFDLQGRKLTRKPSTGLYIHRGKLKFAK